jgi:UDP-galactopyranose mutase
MARQLLHPPVRLTVTARRRPLFLYSQVAWDTVWQRPQEQAVGLSKFRPVLFFSPVQLHEYVSRLSERWQLVRRLQGGRLIVVSPLIFSGEYRSPTVRRINREILRWCVRLFPDFAKSLYMTNSPFPTWLLGELEPSVVSYDLIDDFASFSWAPNDGRETENELIRQCDFGFAGTGYLCDRYAERLPGLKFLPSGVQFERLTAPTPEPTELAALPHPRILYVGTLNDRLDGNLFRVASEAVPKGTLVVVGPKHESFQAPKLDGNVKFIGLVPHERLPAFYQHCDLGIMPFGDSPAARAINPIKTLEYLACGLPVLSTPVPDVIRYYPDVVRVEAPTNWGAALREMLQSDLPEARVRRIDFARDRSWDRLVVEMERRFREFDP